MEVNPFAEESPCEPFLAMYKQEFLLNRIREYTHLVDAVERTDPKRIAEICHKWVGICAPYGFQTLGKFALAISKATKDGQWTRVKAYMEGVRVYLDLKMPVESLASSKTVL